MIKKGQNEKEEERERERGLRSTKVKEAKPATLLERCVALINSNDDANFAIQCSVFVAVQEIYAK